MPRPVLPEETWRTSLSALFDGEEPTVALDDLLDHLSHCPACSQWLDGAARVNDAVRTLPVIQPSLGESVVNRVDVTLCGCRTGQQCLCSDCQCGPGCTCHSPEAVTAP